MFDIKVDKNKTKAIKIHNLNNIKIKDIIIIHSIFIQLKNNTQRYKNDCNNVINKIIKLNHKNFPKINSYLLIGLLNIKNIVFPSISLKSSWLQTNKTQISQNISIIAIQKSVITLLSSQIVSFQREIEKIISKNQNTKIRYKNLFLTISLKVFMAILNILFKVII